MRTRNVENPASYSRGLILSGPEAEARKAIHGRELIKRRISNLGNSSIFNLTGLVRAFPLHKDDLVKLDNQFTFYTHFLGRAEELALKLTGANTDHHSAVMCNRVSSAMLAIMLATLDPGDTVISLVANGRSHPSVQQAVELNGAVFNEIQDAQSLEQSLTNTSCKMLVVTPLTPSKYHIPAADVQRAIALAKDRGILVFVDDAHMMSRSIFYEEPVTFEIGDVDISVWSLDKHVPGPRGAAIVGKKPLMDKISTQVFQFGLEAQSGHYVAMLRGMEGLDRKPIIQAGSLARDLFRRFKLKFGSRVYQAGPGVAFSAEDFSELVMDRSKQKDTQLADSEIAITGSFLLLERYGAITIPITGYPGAAPTFRLMMHPDGARFGLDKLEEAVEETIDLASRLIENPDKVKKLLLG